MGGVFAFFMLHLAHDGEVEGVLSPVEAGVFLLAGFEGVEESDGGLEDLEGVADGG